MQKRADYEHISGASERFFEVRHSRISKNALLESRTNTTFISSYIKKNGRLPRQPSCQEVPRVCVCVCVCMCVCVCVCVCVSLHDLHCGDIQCNTHQHCGDLEHCGDLHLVPTTFFAIL